MFFQFNDGGRKKAGFKGFAGDCVCRSIAIATDKPYLEVYKELNSLAKQQKTKKRKSSSRNGVHRSIYQPYLESLGWEWVPTMKIGQGCKIHLDSKELPPGKLIVRLSKHLTAVVDSVIHDTHDPQRYTIICEPDKPQRVVKRCVYGYFIKPQ